MDLITLITQLIVPLPIRTDRTLRQVPYVTYSLCFLCIFVHLYCLQLTGYDKEMYNHQWGFSVTHPSLITVLTHGFVHADAFHLLGNLLILWIVGTVLECGIGSAMFALVYFTGQIMALLLHGIMIKLFYPGQEAVLIGASGAIAGVTGLAAFRYFYVRVFTGLVLVVIPVYFFWFPLWVYAAYFGGHELLLGLVQVVSGTSDGVAHWAHIGGIALGALVGVLFQESKEGQRENVLQESAKAATGEVSQYQSLADLEAVHRERPNDPEILDAMAGLVMLQGDTYHSAELYLDAIPHFLAVNQNDRAAISYLNVLHHYPETVLEARDQMIIASALETSGHYQEAVQAFGLVYQTYPTSADAENALLRAAQLYHRHLHDNGMAATIYARLLKDYPASPLSSMARERLKQLGPDKA